jgi:serine/threonine protein kinase
LLLDDHFTPLQMVEPRAIGDYALDQEIGHGTFGTVRAARHIATGVQVAIKIVPKDPACSDDSCRSAAAEMNVLRSIHHPNVVAFYDFLQDAGADYIVMELAPHGALSDMISPITPLSESAVRHYLRQIVSGLQYLHGEMGIVHRDLKCENILLDGQNNVKLIDFGLSEPIGSSPSGPCGTLAYLSPEMMAGTGYTASTDIWSLAVIVYTIAVGRLPFGKEDPAVMMKQIAYKEPEYPESCSDELIDLLKTMFERNPAKRITLDGILAHPFLRPNETKRTSCRRSHEETIEKLREAGIAVVAPVEEMPAYRILQQIVQANGNSLPPLHPNEKLTRVGAVNLAPLRAKFRGFSPQPVKTGTRIGGRPTCVVPVLANQRSSIQKNMTACLCTISG